MSAKRHAQAGLHLGFGQQLRLQGSDRRRGCQPQRRARGAVRGTPGRKAGPAARHRVLRAPVAASRAQRRACTHRRRHVGRGHELSGGAGDA
eukprot:scaffold16285_cov85-Isochrysis_galbana.AAC.2